MRRKAYTLVLIALLLAACNRTTIKPDAGGPKAPPSPEERFGNDPELVADFRALSKCTYRDGRLDHACPQMRALQLRLQTKRRTARLKEKLVTTLANLLESKTERVRMAAAASAEPHLGEAELRKALQKSLKDEETPAIRAVVLRQLCRAPGGDGRAFAHGLLASKEEQPAVVRAAAAACLGLARPKEKPLALAALRKLLGPKGDTSDEVKGEACEALGRLGQDEAVVELAAQLGAPKIAWRCAAALAALGGQKAYQALMTHTAGRVERGPLPPAQVRALASFDGGAFVEKAALVEVLKKVAEGKEQGKETKSVAVAELKRLK